MMNKFSCILLALCAGQACGTDLSDKTTLAVITDLEPISPTHPAQPDPDWRATVERRMTDTAFGLERGDGSFSARNPTHRFSASFGPRGAELWALERRTQAIEIGGAAIARGEQAAFLEPAQLALGACRSDGASDVKGECLRRLEGQRGTVTELWENRPDGLEHSFIVHERPAGESEIAVHVEVKNASVTLDPSGTFARIDSESADLHLIYAGLKAWDARGKPLPARMEPGERGLRLTVDDARAAYPITIDPVLAVADWTVDGAAPLSEHGWSVANGGDVNGDGFDNVMVGALADGQVFVYHGSSSGPSTVATTILSGLGNFGISIDGAGDVNGDGFDDVIVGASSFSNGHASEGRALVYHGSAAGLSTTPAWSREANLSDALFGSSVAGAGDVDNDGFDDVIIGAPQVDNGHENEGRAYLYRGSATGLGGLTWFAEGEQSNALFGLTVDGAGDVNGDGFDDVIVGAPDLSNGQTGEGRVFVYHGVATGLASVPAWTMESNQAGARFGLTVAGAGDVNGDGRDDVIVGAYLFDNGQTNEGRAFVYHGGASGLAANAAWTTESNYTNGELAIEVTSAGDVNGDGFSDVAVSQNRSAEGLRQTHVFHGSASGLTAVAVWTAKGFLGDDRFGGALRSGDFNGDGFADLLVGLDASLTVRTARAAHSSTTVAPAG